MAKQKTARKSGSQALWLVVGLSVVGVAVLVGLSLMTAGGGGTVKGATDQSLGGDRNTMGPANAKVKLVEFADYTCSHCATAHKVLEPKLQPYIKSGDLRFEIHHFPLRAESIFAIEAVECAGDQGSWWAMHDKWMSNQVGLPSSNRGKTYAKDLGLDTTKFGQCMESDKYVQKAKDLGAEATKMGVEGTPSFMLNGRFLELKSYDDVITAIEEELKK